MIGNREKIIFRIIILQFCLLLVSDQLYSQDSIIFPQPIVNHIQQYDYKSNPNNIVKSIYEIIFPDSVFDYSEYGVLKSILVDLDSDQSTEILALVGLYSSETNIILLKEIEGKWNLLFTQPVYQHYSSPKLDVINSSSRNKIFYTEQLYERGSGILLEAGQYFKLINNKVYKCLEVVKQAKLHGWGLFLNQDVTSEVSASDSDQLFVSYNYEFFPGAVLDSDSPWDSHREISFVKANQGVFFAWDSLNFIYKLHQCNTPGRFDLNLDKISCFGAFGNDSMFVAAFKYEIQKKLSEGTENEKSLLNKYLDEVKKQGIALDFFGGIEEKGKQGNTKFYGSQKPLKRK